MAPKKLNPQDAFNLVTRRQGKELVNKVESKNIEDGFGGSSSSIDEKKPAWKRYLIATILAIITCTLISGVGVFYWFVSRHAKPEVVEKEPQDSKPLVIDEECAKGIIESNLRAFLKAETNEARLRYVYLPENGKSSLEVHYGVRGFIDHPLWKIERMELVTSVQGEVWFVVYRDLTKKQHLVSFQRYDDGYLLHWSAMTAYCDVPWEKFIVERPVRPVMMRGYIRQYEGILPVGIPEDRYHCFLIEDSHGLFSQMAIMEVDAIGYMALKNLPKASRHPVTLNLGYRDGEGDGITGHGSKVLCIYALKHLRWQKMAMDSRMQGQE